MSLTPPILIVHGGAGKIPENQCEGKLAGVKKAVRDGYKILYSRGTAVDAVEAAVCSMELDDNFNAGYGSVLNIDGNVELEASIMHGKNLTAGCVTLLHDIQHPIKVAKSLMEKNTTVFLGGKGAMDFAIREGFPVLEHGSMVTENARKELEEVKKSMAKLSDLISLFDRVEPKVPGTVGAVAIDIQGNIAVATSSGGTIGKAPGRIGSTPVLGCGTYADNAIGGVSTTGLGESIMRFNLAQKILQKMQYEGKSAQDATKAATIEMHKMFLLFGNVGAITIAKDDIGIYFTTERMPWAYARQNQIHYGINPGEDMHENL